MTKLILVTGAAGFIGSHMARALLEAGHQVVALDNESTGQAANVPQGADYIRADVADAQALEGAFRRRPEAVFHIAGQASTFKSYDNPLDDLRTNVQGTVNVLEVCVKYRVPRLLYASSMVVYGHPESLPIPETARCQPVSYYGITKYAAERYVHNTSARPDLPFKLNVTSFRMFNVYGEGQSLSNPYQGVIGIFIGNALRREPITIHSDGEQCRDFVHIDDVVKAWLLALDNPKAYGQVFNLGCGERHTINDLVDGVLTAFGRTRNNYRVVYAPERPGDQRYMQAEISKAKATLAWQPSVPFAEGLERTVRWAQQQR